MQPRQPLSYQQLLQLTRQVGLDQLGITSTDEAKHRDFFMQWLAQGKHGEMHYLQRYAEMRCQPEQLLRGAKTILCFAWNYNPPSVTESTASPAAAGQGKVARYACGDDYHPRFKAKLHDFWAELIKLCDTPRAKARILSDSAPLLERDFAARAGVGWIGKNCCLIHPQLGSWLFLGEIVTNLEFAPTPPMSEYCGSCTACLDACPTGALTAPYTLDARRCISYLTIEKRGDFNSTERDLLGNHLLGCDICQEICPWNRRAPTGNFFNDHLRLDLQRGDLHELNTQDADAFQQRFGATPLQRTGFNGWQRNLKAVEENLQTTEK